MSWNPLAPALLQILHDLAEIQESTVESCGACPIMSLFLEPLKTSTLPGDVQPYRNLVYNGIYTVLEACLLLLIILLQVRTTSRENSKTSGHNGTTSTSVSWLICMHSTLWITGLCEHLLMQTNLTINSMGCCSPTPTWPQIFLLQQALCRTFWWLFCRNDNFFCPYFLESYICRPQFEHVWTSPKLPWFVCVWVFLPRTKSKELSSDVNQMVAGGCSFSNSMCLPMFTLKLS